MPATLPLWDQHICPSLYPSADLSTILDYQRASGAVLGLNVGYAPQSKANAVAIATEFRAQIDAMDHVRVALTTAEVDQAHDQGELAVFFDLEDTAPLEGDPEQLAEFAELGVRSILTTYNYANAAGAGCMDTQDEGLTDFGRAVVRAANRYGVTVDAAHCSIKSGLEMCALSDAPVIYSHAGMRSVWETPRNVTDDQARACADTGGVVGICGVGIFLGPNEATVEAMVRHLEYAIELVGVEHVGIGSDYSFDLEEANAELARNPHLFPAEFQRYGAIEMVPPVEVCNLAEALLDRGHAVADVAALLGGNFRRVADRTWSR